MTFQPTLFPCTSEPHHLQVASEAMQQVSQYRHLKKAPISQSERQSLMKDRANIRATAERKNLVLDAWDERNETLAAKNHFELGCWLYLAAKRLYTCPTADRAEFLRRLFIEKIYSPGYQFFTIFDFGERQFDSLLESGDAEEVIEFLKLEIPNDKTGNIRRGFEYFGWPL